MMFRFLRQSAARFWILPILFFVVATQDELLSKILGFSSGTITALVELLFALQIVVCAGLAFGAEHRRYLAFPVLVGLGDLIYNIGNYVLKLPLPNQMGCLAYVIPYMGALVAISLGLYRLTKNAGRIERRLLSIAVVISLAVFSLTAINIIGPALFHKQPPLTTLMKSLTVLFSAMESPVVGFSVALLLCADFGLLQVGLFGSLVMHISDMALRYQSVKPNLMGISIFENGWCFGLMLMAIAAAQLHAHKQRVTTRNMQMWVPLSSIRGMTIGFVLTGFIVLWASLSIYYQSIDSAIYSASTLLILTITFAFSILVADFITKQVTHVVLAIQNKGEFKSVLATPFVPQEIKIIAEHFARLNDEIAAEKDYVLTLTSGVSHDLRGPLRSMQNTIPLVSDAAGLECGCRENVADRLKIVEDCAKHMRKTVDELLRNRKEVVEGDPIGEAVKNAAKLSQGAHKGNRIIVEAPDEIAGPRVHGLTRVLGNLLNNALEASPKDEPVRLSLTKHEDRAYQIVIKDQGAGIPDDVLAGVEAGRVTTTKKDGNGLGLSLMISWAKRRGIKYQIDTAPGRGTAIALFIPAGTT